VGFHDFQSVERDVREIFDINVVKDLTDDDKAFAKRMFHRRHVYEHRGGEADQKYITDSGETDVRVGQALRESDCARIKIPKTPLKSKNN
jgi:hypothetical protein